MPNPWWHRPESWVIPERSHELRGKIESSTGRYNVIRENHSDELTPLMAKTGIFRKLMETQNTTLKSLINPLLSLKTHCSHYLPVLQTCCLEMWRFVTHKPLSCPIYTFTTPSLPVPQRNATVTIFLNLSHTYME